MYSDPIGRAGSCGKGKGFWEFFQTDDRGRPSPVVDLRHTDAQTLSPPGTAPQRPPRSQTRRPMTPPTLSPSFLHLEGVGTAPPAIDPLMIDRLRPAKDAVVVVPFILFPIGLPGPHGERQASVGPAVGRCPLWSERKAPCWGRGRGLSLSRRGAGEHSSRERSREHTLDQSVSAHCWNKDATDTEGKRKTVSCGFYSDCVFNPVSHHIVLMLTNVIHLCIVSQSTYF